MSNMVILYTTPYILSNIGLQENIYIVLAVLLQLLLLGLDPGFAAAMAMMANFAGNTNCPLAAIALATELFGGNSILFFVLSIIISYTLSGKYSLYSEQKVMNSKFSID